MSDQTIHLGYGKDGKTRSPGFSGRVVRVSPLPIETIDALEVAAARELPPNANGAEYSSIFARMALEAFVVAVSEPCDPKDRTTVAMRPVTAEQMNRERKKLFTPKDQILLKRIYDQMHAVSQKELDDIMGGAIGVVD
jgi:hypothetical protein